MKEREEAAPVEEKLKRCNIVDFEDRDREPHGIISRSWKR